MPTKPTKPESAECIVANYCGDAKATLQAFVDGTQTPEERQRLEQHVERCAACEHVLAVAVAAASFAKQLKRSGVR